MLFAGFNWYRVWPPQFGVRGARRGTDDAHHEHQVAKANRAENELAAMKEAHEADEQTIQAMRPGTEKHHATEVLEHTQAVVKAKSKSVAAKKVAEKLSGEKVAAAHELDKHDAAQWRGPVRVAGGDVAVE